MHLHVRGAPISEYKLLVRVNTVVINEICCSSTGSTKRLASLVTHACT